MNFTRLHALTIALAGLAGCGGLATSSSGTRDLDSGNGARDASSLRDAGGVDGLGTDGDVDGSRRGSSDAGPRIVELARNQDRPIAIAVDSADVYWTTEGGNVMKVPVGGGTPITLASVSGLRYADSIAVDSASIYLTANLTTVLSVPLAGGTIDTLAAGVEALAIAVDATSVYWVSPSGVLSVPLHGGMPKTLAAAYGGQAIAVDATSVFWTDSTDSSGDVKTGRLMKVPIGGGLPTTLASQQDDPRGVAVDATSVYWLANGPRLLQRTSIEGGPATTLAAGAGAAIALDATSVYWITGDDGAFDLQSMAKSGGTPTILVARQDVECIAIDTTSIYWGDNERSSIMKLTPK